MQYAAAASELQSQFRVNEDVLLPYMAAAPFALAFERALECRLYKDLAFVRPVLDVGCGEGLFARIAFSDRIDTGIDPNPRELQRARELGAYDELIECFGDAIPRPDGSYNTVFSNSVLEHIPELEPVLREVRRLLAHGGRFYVTVPSDMFNRYTVMSSLLSGAGLPGPAARFRRFFNRFWAHYHDYSLDGWKELMRRSGFEIVEAFTYDPRRICLLNDFLAPFSIVEWITKRIANRWTLFPAVRKVFCYPIFLAARRILAGGERCERGGLVFLSLRKGAEP